jgi:single-strand DNA-binding protein
MILSGLARLGRDAVVRNTPDGTAVANLALAYNYGKKDADGKRPTQWVDASLWGERATKLAQYLTKGTQISVALEDVCGHTYKKSDGTSGFSIKGRVMSLEFAASKPAEPKPAEQRQEQKPQPATKPKTSGDHPFADMDDDIPF